jgi:mRNA interferase MazF
MRRRGLRYIRLDYTTGDKRRLASALTRESVVNVSQLITLDKRLLTARVGRAPPEIPRGVDAGIRLLLSL